MREVVKTALSTHDKWIMDGYPRTLEQVLSLFLSFEVGAVMCVV